MKRRAAFGALAIAVALTLQLAPIPRGWVERDYAGTWYAAISPRAVAATNHVAFALGDALLVIVVLAAIASLVFAWRTTRGGIARRIVATTFTLAVDLALLAIWFDAAWAINYRRAPIVDRVDFSAARVTPRAVAAFSQRIVSELNAQASLAHAHNESEAELQAHLAADFAPVVARLGDGWTVVESRPKTTLFNLWFAAAGIGGTWDPFAYETVLNADFLAFERPFALAHEWGHVAGFGDESDANLVAALTTLRSRDPLIRYSGLFWAYGFLPAEDRARLPVTPLVRSDLIAARRRFLEHYVPQLFAFQWFAYDKYLRANRVTAGVTSYSLFVRVLVGTTLDKDGLPLPKSGV